MIKTWFVTGTSSGLGRLLTEKLLARGDRVAATLRQVNALDELKAQYGDRLWVAPLDVYENTPAREMRRAFAAGTFTVKGDPIKMAQAMIDSVERSPAPRRLALGSSSYTAIRAALVDRLGTLDAQREIALSTDEDA